MTSANNLFLEAAFAIGAQLCRDAIWDGGRCNWLGDNKELVNQSWLTVHRSFGPDLYSGTCGIGLFLSHLSKLSKDQVVRKTAEGAMAQALSRLDAISPVLKLGFFSGSTGVAVALLEAGEALERPDWIERGRALIDEQCTCPIETVPPDFVNGAAGAICGVLRFPYLSANEKLLEHAIRLGHHLIATSNRAAIGWSWTTLPKGLAIRDLTGMAHGAAGVGYALLELFRHTQIRDFQSAAEEAFRYERQWFQPSEQNWPDFRVSGTTSAESERVPCSLMWCHGAPGIGLTRLLAYQVLKEQVYLQEVEAAIHATLAGSELMAANRRSFCLCHGLAGNAELMLIAGELLDRPSLRIIVERIAMYGIANYLQPSAPWPCGIVDGGETPGLMLGVAGIGYFFLRVYDSRGVPSILLPVPSQALIGSSAASRG